MDYLSQGKALPFAEKLKEPTRVIRRIPDALRKPTRRHPQRWRSCML
jgi:hypothetical protein